jgi:hypothetical protein
MTLVLNQPTLPVCPQGQKASDLPISLSGISGHDSNVNFWLTEYNGSGGENRTLVAWVMSPGGIPIHPAFGPLWMNRTSVNRSSGDFLTTRRIEDGAPSRNRTYKVFRPTDFKSVAYACSAMRAWYLQLDLNQRSFGYEPNAFATKLCRHGGT